MNLADRIDDGRLHARIVLVVASRECTGAEKARRRGLAVHVLPEPDPESLRRLLRSAGAEWVVLAGYLRLLPDLPGFENRVVNIHPALLPAFGGKGMYGDRVHEAVLASGASTSGCTVHLVNNEYDRGPILAQATCDVLPDDTPRTLGARVFELEKELYPRVLAELFAGRIEAAARAGDPCP